MQIWGVVGVEWGINRTMAQIHGLLLTSPDPLSTEDVMAALKISRGNANMNLRELVNWGLLARVTKPGDRKEYFVAEKSVWGIAQRIVAERKRRELDPLLAALEQLQADFDLSDRSADAQQFRTLLGDLSSLGRKGARLLDLVLKLDQKSFFRPLAAIFRR